MKSLGSLRLQPYDESEIDKCSKKSNVEHRFVCVYCIEICNTIEKLKLHYENVHGYTKSIENENKNSKICTVCKMTFKNSKTLSKHVKTVHYKLKSFICSVCSKQFSRKATLDIHLRQHLSDETAKTFACPHPECSFRAADPSVMSKHKKIHSKSNVGKYKCLDESCNYFAIQATGLKNHMISKHLELYATMKCTMCDFVSVNSERLRRHLNDHEKGLLTVASSTPERKKPDQQNEESQKRNLNSSMEISSDCFLPIESNHSLDTGGGVTIIHIHNTSSSTNVHSEDTVF